MPPTLLSVEALQRFGDVVALHSINLEINEGDIIGLVGSNGAGKTLLRLLKSLPANERTGCLGRWLSS